MPGRGDQRSSPIGSVRSSGASVSSAPLGTNWAAIGSLGSDGSIRPATSSVSATENSSATRRSSPSRSGATKPRDTRSSERKVTWFSSISKSRPGESRDDNLGFYDPSGWQLTGPALRLCPAIPGIETLSHARANEMRDVASERADLLHEARGDELEPVGSHQKHRLDVRIEPGIHPRHLEFVFEIRHGAQATQDHAGVY